MYRVTIKISADRYLYLINTEDAYKAGQEALRDMFTTETRGKDIAEMTIEVEWLEGKVL